MTTYGLTAEGFVPKTVETIRDDMNQRIRDRHGASLDLSDQDPFGFLVGLVAAELAECWEVTEAVNSATTREGATDARLDDVGLLTGTFRPEARPSEITLTLTGTPTTNVLTGSRAEAESTGAQFATLADATIAAAAAWAGATAYVVGDRVTNSGRIYVCITAGTSAGSGGPTTTAEDITDNTAHWRYLGDGTGYVDVEAECTEDGPTVALSGDVNTIVTSVGGWDGVINVADATVGADEASDEEYRLLQEIDLAAAGTGTVDAIVEALLEVDDVTAAKLFVNNTDVTDGDGVPPHAIEALVLGGTDAAIRTALFENVAAGIATRGTVSGTVTDSDGNNHTIEFSRPAEIPAYVELDVYFPTGETPAGATDLIKTAITVAGDARGIGADGRASAVIAAVMAIAGVYDVANVLVDDVDPPVASSFSVSSRQISTWDSANITVNLFEGTP